MNYAITHYLPWLLSANTIYSMLLAGNKKRGAWAFGLAGQLLWLVYIVTIQAWGLLPMNLALWVVYGRNYLAWK
jgi:hypothetical protein